MTVTSWRAALIIVGFTAIALFLVRTATKDGDDVMRRTDNDDGRQMEDSYDSSEFAPKRRSPNDPNVARISGTITQAGRVVPGALVRAVVLPVGHHGTPTDVVTSQSDGTFTLVVTADSLTSNQQVAVDVRVGELRGSTVVMAAPGVKVENVEIEVRRGVKVRGRVTNQRGTALGYYDSNTLAVRLGDGASKIKDDGSFELVTYAGGRQRFAVVGGGITHAVKELPLAGVAPSIVMDNVAGDIGPIALTIDEDAANRMFNQPSWVDMEAAGTVLVRVVAARGSTLPAAIMCWTTGGRGTFPLSVDKKPIAVPLLTFKGQTQIDCETDDDLNVRIFDPAPGRVLDIPLVRPSFDDVDLGVELRAHPNGTSVVDVADEAKAAGLQPGDIITA